MATQILAVGDTANATSTSVTVAPGETAALSLLQAGGNITGPAKVRVQYQNSAGAWLNVGNMTEGRPIFPLTIPGTYRAVRLRGNVGVDRSDPAA